MLFSCLSAVVPESLASHRKSTLGGRLLEGSGERGGYSPADLRSAYNLPTAGGAGLTIAITIAYDYPTAESDLATYRETYGLPPCTNEEGCFEKVNQRGNAGPYPEPRSGWSAEAALDLDMTSAVCPECKLLLVEADDNSKENLPLAVKAASELSADVISDSWGGGEFSEEGLLDTDLDHPGVPVLFASGDNGYGAEYPAASPYVAAIGGTSLRKDEGARGWRESAWSGAGSGCSKYEEKPAWQTDEGCAKRTVADVSAVANPETPVSVYDTYGAYEGWLLFGGTSVATPILAGVEALSSSSERAKGAELFWEEGPEGKLFDPGEGRNGDCPPAAEYLCMARLGYDGPTGWGTPGASRPAAPAAATYEAAEGGAQAATLKGAVNPNGEETSYHFEYDTAKYEGKTSHGISVPIPDAGAGSGAKPVPAESRLTGLALNTTYHYRLVASNGLGTSYGGDHVFTTSEWSPQYMPRKEQREEMFGVSCPAANACVSVGLQGVYYEPPSLFHNNTPLVERWDGGKWTRELVPVYHPPASGYSSSLHGVSCSSADACMAVGTNYEIDIGYQPLVERWDGSEWSTVPAPIPADAGKVNGQYVVRLHGISCTSPTFCVLVGEFVNETEEGATLAEVWDGSNWTVQPSPNPPGHHRHILWGVSCVATAFCIAVGQNDEPTGGEKSTLIESWDGTKWSLATAPNLAGGLMGVSCSSEQECLAVGGSAGEFGGAGRAEAWDGTEWVSSSLARPMRGVSCPMAGWCAAAGGDNSTHEAFAAVWHDGKWTENDPVLPTDASDEAMRMYGISCLTSGCTGVGWYWSWGYQPLAEHLSRLPTVFTEPAAVEGTSKATLHATVNPEGLETAYQFEYDTAEYKEGEGPHGTALPATPEDVGAGYSDVHLSQPIAGLTVGTTYHFRIVASNAAGTTTSAERSFIVADAPTVSNDPATAITQTIAVLHGSVDNEGAEGGSSCKFVIARKSSPATTIDEPPCEPDPVEGNTSTDVQAEASGLDPNTAYVYRVVARNSGGTATGAPDEEFTTLPNAPAVQNDPATAITQTIAVLHGSVDNEGAEGGSSCKFVVVRQSASAIPAPEPPIAEPPCDPTPVTGDGSTAVQATITDLDPNAEYAYRVVAENEGGTTAGIPDQGFATLPNAPVASNDPATSITQITAVLHGHVDNEGAGGGSSCLFVVAPASSPATTVAEPPCDPNPVEGDASVAVQAEATDLDPNTAYVYRVVAQNSGGIGKASPDTQFATLPDPPKASFSVSTASPTAMQTVSFDGSTSSALDGRIDGYSWSFGDGSHGGGATPSHVFAHPGTYNVTLTVSGPAGLTDSVSHVVQVADAPPLASFSVGTHHPAASQVVAFDGSASSDTDGSIASYSWSFGDGSHGSGPTPSHIYVHPGSYSAVLIVNDDAGLTAAAQRVVSVGSASNAFALRRSAARCNGTIALTLRAPAPGTFRATASITGPLRRKAPHGHRARRHHRRTCLAQASVIRLAQRRPARSSRRRHTSTPRRHRHRGLRYGTGRARADAEERVRLLTIRPRRVVLRAMRRHPHRRWRIQIAIRFKPRGGLPRTMHKVVLISGLPRRACR